MRDNREQIEKVINKFMQELSPYIDDTYSIILAVTPAAGIKNHGYFVTRATDVNSEDSLAYHYTGNINSAIKNNGLS